MEESNTGVFLSVGLSVFTALVASATLCSVSHDCVKGQTCAELDDGFCSFTNVVSPAGYRLFNTTTSAGALQALERGVCPPGERQNLIDGDLACLRQRSFPDALNTEIMDAGASEYHDRYCGKWIASQARLSTKYWALYDAEAVAEDINDAILTRYKIRSAVTTTGKFRASCVRMVTSNSGGAAGQLAYEHLKALLPVPSTREGLITMAGVLPGHYCDAPARIGVTYKLDLNGGLTINVTSGASLRANTVSEMLYAAGASRSTMSGAEAFAHALQRSGARVVLKADVDLYVQGSVRGTVLDGIASTGITTTADVEHLARFIAVADARGVGEAHSYLLGLAATCAYAVRSVITGEMGLATTMSDEDSLDSFEVGHTAALGRLPTARGGDRIEAISPERMLNASTTSWSALRRVGSVATSHRSSATSSCEHAMATAFPDELDASVFNFLVPLKLYNKLQTMDSAIREAVRATMNGPIIRPLLADAAGAATLVASSVLRVAGAPRKSWAGRDAVALAPGFESTDGSLVMMLKQARAVYVDRLGLALSGAGVVQHPPLMPSTSRNGYFLYRNGVAMLLPGILVPPFAGAEYDDPSLYSRIGYVIAHGAPPHTTQRPFPTNARPCASQSTHTSRPVSCGTS
jgi:hypothetical protein